jgi:type II secretory pathway pseudopilin PulG
MPSIVKHALVALLLVTIVAVFVAPGIQLEPTALRASRAAQALQMALLSAALAFTALLCFAGPSLICRGCASSLTAHGDLLDLNCIRLC